MCSNNLKLPIRAAPYRHQRDAAAYALDRLADGGGAALLMEMGTGKTLTTIAIVGRLWQEKRVQRLLVVAPLSILGVWEDEFRKFADYDYSLAVLEGTGARKADTIRHMTGAALQVLVVNYESAWRLEKELAAWKPDMIVCDEGHKIKTHNIAASKALHRLGARVPYRLLLTGTVITNKPIDVFSQYKFADPAVFGSSFYLFRNRYFDMVGYGNYTPVMKKSMEAEFTEKLHSIAFRATKAECLDLPECTDIVQRVELEPAARRVYLQLVKDSYADLSSGSVTVTNVLTKAICRKRAEYAMELAQYEFADAPTLDTDEIAAILPRIDSLVSWAEDVKEYALKQALAGVRYPGYKLVEGRSNRRYSDEVAVAKVVSNAGYDPYEKKLLTITAMQKQLGKKRFEELLNGLVIKPQGKPVLAPISDTRPKYNTATTDFEEENNHE